MAALELSLLGSPRVALDDVPVHFDVRKAVALLTYLALNGGQAHRDSLVTLLWSRYGRVQGGSALRRTRSTLRCRHGAGWFQTESESVRLIVTAGLHVDALRVRALLSECARHPHAEGLPVCAACLPPLSDADEFYRGEFLSGCTLKDSTDFDDWRSEVTDAFRRDYHHLLSLLALCRAAPGSSMARSRRRRGEGQVVVLTGDAGIGKSRLIDRLMQHVTELDPDVRPLWLQARSVLPSIDVPYLLVEDLLKPYLEGPYGFAEARLSERDLDFCARTREAIALATRLPATEIDEIASALSRLTSLEPVDEPRTRRVYAAVIRLLRALAASAPVVIVFDDLQWASEPSFELVHTLIRKLKGDPKLLVCAYRDERDKRGRRLPATAARHRSEERVEVRLRRLPTTESASLLDYFESKRAELPSSRKDILRRAEGNPLFLEELASCAPGGPGGAKPGVPARIKSLLLPSYLILPEPHRRLLTESAAIGSSFPKRVLASIHDGAELDALLDELEQRGFLVIDRVLPEVTVAFRQFLMCETIRENTPEAWLSSLRRRIEEARALPPDDPPAARRSYEHERALRPDSSPRASARARARRTEAYRP